MPPELAVEKVADGRVHVRGGGRNGWTAELSVVGFEDDSRWWLTRVDWAWRVDGSQESSQFTPEERQQILDIANLEVLAPRPIPQERQRQTADSGHTVVDSPLVRIHNFLQHLSLTYQLEVLFTQAVTLSQSRWRGNLLVDIDRSKKNLRLRYWRYVLAAVDVAHYSRPRQPQQASAPTQTAVGRRSQAAASGPRGTPVGGTLLLSIAETKSPLNAIEHILRDVVTTDLEPVDRILRLQIGMEWQVGEAGTGGGLKLNDLMDLAPLKLVSGRFDNTR